MDGRQRNPDYEFINNFCVSGAFLRLYRGLGDRAEAIIGLPISREMIRRCGDGELHHVQYFERWVMELHGDMVVGRNLGAADYYRLRAEGAG